ncbi:MAG: hypothetical protein ABIP53_09125, partial [Candidatus Limnocylindrales bacterium]
MPAKAKKEKPPPGPDDLVRSSAGEYLSGDGRFTVRQSEATWYVVDNEQTNEFGQELIHGPFGSMKAAHEQLSGVRTVKPLLRSGARSKSAPSRKAATPVPPPPKPETWIDRLARSEQNEVRRLIRALEGEGIDDAESIVRRDRGGIMATIATALLDKRLAATIDEMPDKDRAIARRVVDMLKPVFSASDRFPDRLPGWALFETGPSREPTKRRLR